VEIVVEAISVSVGTAIPALSFDGHGRSAGPTRRLERDARRRRTPERTTQPGYRKAGSARITQGTGNPGASLEDEASEG
jgi:hypothetical protein